MKEPKRETVRASPAKDFRHARRTAAANLHNLRVQSTARAAVSIITASGDPPQTLGSFLAALADGLRPPTTSTSRAAPGARPAMATRSTRKL
jgi:hypothetical protein